MTVMYRELTALKDHECQHCGQIIPAGSTYLRHVSTPSAPDGHWVSFRAHGRYPADCPHPREEKSA